MLLLAMLLLADAPTRPPAPADPFRSLKTTVVDAIRNCGTAETGEIRVCSRDRGFAEGGNRIEKLKKPQPVDTGSGVKIELSGGTAPPPER